MNQPHTPTDETSQKDHRSRQRGVRKRSETVILGLPLYDIAAGPDESAGETRGHAKGIIAIGDMATGVIAIGGRALGVVAIGGLAMGGVSIGGLSAGLLACGGVCLGLLAGVGGVVAGGVVLGGVAFGMKAFGGVAHSVLPPNDWPWYIDIFRG